MRSTSSSLNGSSPTRARQLVERGARGEQRVLVLHRPQPDGELALTARAARLRRRRVAALLREVLDVRVVAVVEAARLAQPLHEAPVELAVLAERRARHQPGGEVGAVARQRPRHADRDRRRRRLLLDEPHARLVRRLQRDLDQRRARRRQRRRRRALQLLDDVGRVAAGDADGQPVAREDARRLLLDVVERERAQIGRRGRASSRP